MVTVMLHKAETSDVFQVLKVPMTYTSAYKCYLYLHCQSMEVWSIELIEPKEQFRIFQNRYSYIRSANTD